MKKTRIVITGLGVVSSIGLGIKAFVEALREGRSGASPVSVFDTRGYEGAIGCEVRNFDPAKYIHYTDYFTVGRSSQFAIAASQMAIQDAGFESKALADTNTAVSMGTTDGESQALDRLAAQWTEDGLEALDPEFVRQSPANKISVSIAQEFGLSGEAVTFSTACAAGNYAIGYAYDLLRVGEVQFALCGGADCMCRKTYVGFHRLGTIAPQYCQPFDKNRKGILTGEGAGLLFLETLDSALSRNARIYAEVLGYGISCDAKHMVAPDLDSIANSMRIAHNNADVQPADIDYVCAHGTGTQANDVVETSAIRQVFGEAPPPVSSIKSMIGHTMGAASAIASLASVAAIYYGFLPPTINHHETDLTCMVDCVPNHSRPAQLKVVQNNGFAFGGNNAITLFGRLNGGV